MQRKIYLYYTYTRYRETHCYRKKPDEKVGEYYHNSTDGWQECDFSFSLSEGTIKQTTKSYIDLINVFKD